METGPHTLPEINTKQLTLSENVEHKGAICRFGAVLLARGCKVKSSVASAALSNIAQFF